MSEMPPAENTGIAPPTDSPPPSAKRVVVIDDDPDDLWLLRRSLTRAAGDRTALDLKICRGASVALDLLRPQEKGAGSEASLDLVLIDVNMPGMSGLDLLRLIRSCERFRETAVMVMTSAVDDELAEEASAAGADAVLTKPDTLAGLDALTSSLLRRQAPGKGAGNHSSSRLP
jgi:CheY-like chemotaxis protein